MNATIAPRELASLIERDPSTVVIDVRTPAEYRMVHAERARPMPLDSLDKLKVEELANGERTVYVLCKAGGRAGKACEKLASQGFARAVVVEGGTDAWIAAGLPVERGDSGVISLERQVRIVVGALNLGAAVLALAVSPWFALLCALFGGGLLFAGITDWCGMGLLLAKMPWNNRPATCSRP